MGGYNTGTYVAAFYNETTMYVAHRGTGDGEWPDNATSLVNPTSPQLQEALSFFDATMEKMIADGLSQNVIVTGHSKGGNKAQYITMNSKFTNMINACYSFNGQGMSADGLEHAVNNKELADKIYSISIEPKY